MSQADERAEIEDIFLFLGFDRGGEKNLTRIVRKQSGADDGIFFFFFSVLCAKWDCRDSFYYYPPLIGPQSLAQSVRPSNTLHHLHNNTQTRFNDV